MTGADGCQTGMLYIDIPIEPMESERLRITSQLTAYIASCTSVNWRATAGDHEVISCAPVANGVHRSESQTDDPVVVAPPLLVMHSAHLLPHLIDCLPQSWPLNVDIALLANPPFGEALQSPVPSLVHLEQVLRLSDWFYGCTPTSQSIASLHQLVEHHQ